MGSARSSLHRITMFQCGQLPKPQLKIVKCSTLSHMIPQPYNSRREGCKIFNYSFTYLLKQQTTTTTKPPFPSEPKYEGEWMNIMSLFP